MPLIELPTIGENKNNNYNYNYNHHDGDKRHQSKLRYRAAIERN